MTTIQATVLESEKCSLLVCDETNSQEVMVHTQNACHFCPGDRVCVRFNGMMAMSLPPQVTATSVVKLPSRGCGK